MQDEQLIDVTMFTVAEVAKAARVSKMTVYRLIHKEKIECVRVGRSFRIPEPEVKKLLHMAAGEQG